MGELGNFARDISVVQRILNLAYFAAGMLSVGVISGLKKIGNAALTMRTVTHVVIDDRGFVGGFETADSLQRRTYFLWRFSNPLRFTELFPARLCLSLARIPSESSNGRDRSIIHCPFRDWPAADKAASWNGSAAETVQSVQRVENFFAANAYIRIDKNSSDGRIFRDVGSERSLEELGLIGDPFWVTQQRYTRYARQKCDEIVATKHVALGEYLPNRVILLEAVPGYSFGDDTFSFGDCAGGRWSLEIGDVEEFAIGK